MDSGLGDPDDPEKQPMDFGIDGLDNPGKIHEAKYDIDTARDEMKKCFEEKMNTLKEQKVVTLASFVAAVHHCVVGAEGNTRNIENKLTRSGKLDRVSGRGKRTKESANDRQVYKRFNDHKKLYKRNLPFSTKETDLMPTEESHVWMCVAINDKGGHPKPFTKVKKVSLRMSIQEIAKKAMSIWYETIATNLRPESPQDCVIVIVRYMSHERAWTRRTPVLKAHSFSFKQSYKQDSAQIQNLEIFKKTDQTRDVNRMYALFWKRSDMTFPVSEFMDLSMCLKRIHNTCGLTKLQIGEPMAFVDAAVVVDDELKERTREKNQLLADELERIQQGLQNLPINKVKTTRTKEEEGEEEGEEEEDEEEEDDPIQQGLQKLPINEVKTKRTEEEEGEEEGEEEEDEEEEDEEEEDEEEEDEEEGQTPTENNGDSGKTGEQQEKDNSTDESTDNGFDPMSFLTLADDDLDGKIGNQPNQFGSVRKHADGITHVVL